MTYHRIAGVKAMIRMTVRRIPPITEVPYGDETKQSMWFEVTVQKHNRTITKVPANLLRL